MKKTSFQTKKYVIIVIILFIVIIGTSFRWQFQQKNKPIIDNSAISTPALTATIALVDPKIKEFGIKIEKLNILAPVIKNVDGNDKLEYGQALTRGVAQFKGTALPGEKGNIFIFGHSSADVKNNYSKIFSELNDLEKDNKITIYYRNVEHKYKVKEKKIVDVTNVSVTTKGDKEMLTLMTCWPVGAKAKRLIVIATPE